MLDQSSEIPFFSTLIDRSPQGIVSLTPVAQLQLRPGQHGQPFNSIGPVNRLAPEGSELCDGSIGPSSAKVHPCQQRAGAPLGGDRLHDDCDAVQVAEGESAMDLNFNQPVVQPGWPRIKPFGLA
jgi:hypothetical protein